MKRSHLIWTLALIVTALYLSGCESLKENRSVQLSESEKVQLAFDKRD